jgi:hypothetical protein
LAAIRRYVMAAHSLCRRIRERAIAYAQCDPALGVLVLRGLENGTCQLRTLSARKHSLNLLALAVMPKLDTVGEVLVCAGWSGRS